MDFRHSQWFKIVNIYESVQRVRYGGWGLGGEGGREGLETTCRLGSKINI